jgi:hypothetical protein
MLFGETVTVYCENHTEHTNTLCGQNTVSFNVKASGIPVSLRMLFAIPKPLPLSTTRSLVKNAIRVPSNDPFITMKLTGIPDYNNYELVGGWTILKWILEG